jgi:hypothetical protein
MLDPARGVDDLERALAIFEGTAHDDGSADAAPAASGSLWWCAGAVRADAWHAAGLPAGADFDRLLQPCP